MTTGELEVNVSYRYIIFSPRNYFCPRCYLHGRPVPRSTDHEARTCPFREFYITQEISNCRISSFAPTAQNIECSQQMEIVIYVGKCDQLT